MKLRNNIVTVLTRLTEQVKMMDEESVEAFAGSLDTFFDDLRSNDFFGTEGQLDPRGDFREGTWSIKKIQK